jgi:hypothetical protein
MSDSLPKIDSRAGFQAALHWGFETAVGEGARCLTAVDPTFAEWPLDAPALLARLTAWLRLPQRRLVLLAASFDTVPRQFPRFTAWRRDWAHAVQPWQAPEELASTLPTLLLDDRVLSVHLADAAHWRGRVSLDPHAARLWRERVETVLQRSEATFSVHTLGL